MKPRDLHVPTLLLAAALALPVAVAAQATRAGDLRYPPLPRFDVPQPERVVLDNGMVVMLLEDHELPLVEATALIRAGARFDPAGKVGLASLGTEVMRSGGTESMPGDTLDDFLESRAASVELNADEDMAQARLSSLKADFPQVLRVFADVLRRPAFDAAKLEVARTQALAEVARQNDDAGQVMSREFRKIVYGADSPFARRESFATLGGIRREDLVAWHRDAFHPDRILLGLVGDFQREEALRLIREAFGDWPRGPQWKPAEAAFRRQASPGVYHAEKDDVTQSYIEIGHLGVRIDDPDYYALEVLNQVLSGSFASRLFSNVRTRKGLAYAVGGGVFSDWDHPGLAVLYVSTKTETTAAGIEALLEEARNLKAQPPTAQEVEKAKQSLLNSFVFRFDTRREVLARQLLLDYFGYPLDWLSRYRAGVEAVTVEQVRQAARHLRPEEFAILVVGPASGLDKPLSTFGKVTPVDITIPGAAEQGHQGQ
ncbi:MAG TPA: pitrilysin family protein [Thermoanaerobaculia bacterium]|nr:pitrilysin family protein [Thermoanaerobaculia bacterium]